MHNVAFMPTVNIRLSFQTEVIQSLFLHAKASDVVENLY